MIDLNSLGDECCIEAIRRGVYNDMQSFDDLMTPLFSEILEAREAYAKGNYTKGPHSLGMELTDMLFTVLSIGRKLRIDFNANAEYKLAFNKARRDKYDHNKGIE